MTHSDLRVLRNTQYLFYNNSHTLKDRVTQLRIKPSHSKM